MLLNLDAHPEISGDEYAGYTPEEHLQLLHSYAPEIRFDYVVADQNGIRDKVELETMVREIGGKLVISDLRKVPGGIHHDIGKLISTFSHIFEEILV